MLLISFSINQAITFLFKYSCLCFYKSVFKCTFFSYFTQRKTQLYKTGVKDHCYGIVYYITLNSNCEAQGASKHVKNILENRARSQNKCMLRV